MRTLVTYSLNWELRREHGVYGDPGQTYTNYHSLYLVGQRTLTCYTEYLALRVL